KGRPSRHRSRTGPACTPARVDRPAVRTRLPVVLLLELHGAAGGGRESAPCPYRLALSSATACPAAPGGSRIHADLGSTPWRPIPPFRDSVQSTNQVSSLLLVATSEVLL